MQDRSTAQDNKLRHLLVLGGAGRCGQSVLKQALQHGYRVTALLRDPAKLDDLQHDNLTIDEGDAADEDSITRCLQYGVDAVVSTLGTYIRNDATPMTDITRTLIAVMQSQAVSRIVLMSSMGVGDSKRWGGLTEQFVIRFVLRHVLADKTSQEQLLRQSDLDWTILRPPRILESLEHSDYSRWQSELVGFKPRWKISRADAAKEMLGLLEDPSTIGQTWHISY